MHDLQGLCISTGGNNTKNQQPRSNNKFCCWCGDRGLPTFYQRLYIPIKEKKWNLKNKQTVFQNVWNLLRMCPKFFVKLINRRSMKANFINDFTEVPYIS